MSNLKVFVYGTLKPGEANYQRYCGGKVVETQRAIAYGQLFDLLLGYPAMTENSAVKLAEGKVIRLPVTQESSDFRTRSVKLGESPVHGFVLTFADAATLSVLDALEDYDPERLPQENEYYRQQIETYSPARQSLGLAWVYLMTVTQVNHFKGVLLPSGWWSSYVNRLTSPVG